MGSCLIFSRNFGNYSVNLYQEIEFETKTGNYCETSQGKFDKSFLAYKKLSKLPRIFRGPMTVPEYLGNNRKLSRNNKPEVDFFFFFVLFFSFP